MVSFRWRTTVIAVVGFKWRTLVVSGLLQVKNYCGWLNNEERWWLFTENDSGELQMENCSIRL